MMIRSALHCHPDTPCTALRRIEVELVRDAPQSLTVRYMLLGDISSLRIPEIEAGRADELWQHTCCELFVSASNDAVYSEFNFSPSGAWAAYSFQAYRQGMESAMVSAPRIQTKQDTEHLLLEATVHLATIANADANVALSAVIEETDGRKSWWALRHPPGPPDFHHRDGFVLKL